MAKFFQVERDGKHDCFLKHRQEADERVASSVKAANEVKEALGSSLRTRFEIFECRLGHFAHRTKVATVWAGHTPDVQSLD